MPQRNLELQERQISKQLKKNTLIATVCAVAGFSLLIPAFNVAGSRFDQQEFCFLPKHLTNPEQHDFCTGNKVRRGIAWRVAQEASESSQFKNKVTFLAFFPAKKPNAGLYGLCSAGFFFCAFLMFKNGTNQLEDTLDIFVWNKRSKAIEHALASNQHLEIEQLKTQQEGEFIKDIMSREHGEALCSLMSGSELEFLALRQEKATQLDETSQDLQLQQLKTQIAEQQEKEAKHKSEVQKMNNVNNTVKTSTLESLLKQHEAGWLWTLAKGKMPIIIYGKQGAYKSYTAACLALLKAHFQSAKIISISDSHDHQNRDEAWKELIPFEPELYGSNENWDEYADSIDEACSRWANRTLKDAPIVSIWDELTTMGMSIPEKSVVLMPKVISSPRKANENVICITHSLTNAGLGGIEGMSEAIKEGTLRLRLKADAFQEPLFKGDLSGWVDESGNEQNDMPVTLPPWFRPTKLVEMF